MTSRVPIPKSNLNLKATLPALCAAAVFVFSACAGDPSGPRREVPRDFTLQEAAVADASIGFGLNLYKEVAGAETEPNVLVSPLSAAMALGMTMNGAESETYDAMRAALGFGSLGEAEINEAYRGLIAQLLARDPKVTFNLANSIWYKNGLNVKQPFVTAGETYFNAEVSALDFSDPDAPKTISAWAEEETGGRIKELIKQIEPYEVMFLVNAVYFKAPWSSQFDPKSTRPGPFTRADGSTVSTPLMTRDGSFRFSIGQELQVLELPYADSAFSMVLLAPANAAPLSSLEQRLTPAFWNSALAGVQPARAMVTMPRFKFDYGQKLNDALSALGMAIAFDAGRADFDRIADVSPERLYISRVEQKTYIDVNEAGTEAAAATSVGVGVTSLPPQLRFDRPFLFAIRERESGSILFIGRVGDPTQN